jgi:heptosyltransferase-2
LPPGHPEKILIVGPAWIGDMVMAQSLYKLLRQRNPEVIIDVVAPAWSEPLVGRMDEVRDTVGMPLGHGEFGFFKRRQIGRGLRAAAYDSAIVMPRSLKSALVPFFARIPVRTGFRGEMRYGLLNDVRTLNPKALDQTVKRFLSLGLPAGAPLPDAPAPGLTVDEENLARLRSTLELDASSPAVALMPGAAYGPAKHWPLEYFSELAAGLVAGGAMVWVLGSEGEHADGEFIRRHAGDGVVNLCGRTRLEDTVDILSAAAVAVTNDSGLMHVAAAAGTHVMAIYGSTTPTFTPPMTARSTIRYLDLECSPCFRRECPLGHLNCLREISPESVLSGAQDVLRGAA